MAKLPCVPQSRVFTLKDTGETMSYDQVRQYLMENPDLWSGAKEGKEVANALKDVESTAKALEGVKPSKNAIDEDVYRGEGEKVNVTYGGRTDEGLGKFYTDNKTMAEWFAGLTEYNYNKDKYVKTKGKGSVSKSNLKINNPYIIDETHPKYNLDNEIDAWRILMDEMNAKTKAEVLNYVYGLIAKGYDGVVLKGNTTNYYADDQYNIYVKFTDDQFKGASEAYHADKKAGKETELTKAVEELLGGKEVAMPQAEVQVEQYKPITKKNIEIGKFSKDEALDYEEDEKELDSGRMSTYISSMTVDVMDEDGNSIGNLIRLKDEDGIATYQATDIDGNELTLDEFDTKDEAIQALLDAHNKQAEKEFNKEQKRLAKEREKQAAKKQASAMPGNTNADIANRIRNKKQKGALSAIDFGISVTIYNGALDFMASQVDKGTKLGKAIANTIKWIDEKMAGAKWNKGAFGKYMNDTYSVTLPNGREVEVVRDDSKETAEVINGWYSELEQKILDSKEDKLPAATWAKRLKSKEDEDVWTGVRDFLESKKPSEQVSKKELRDWMKDNRVEISEVVKGEYKGGNLKWAPAREGSKGFLVYDGIDGNKLSIIHNVESDFIYIEDKDGEVVFDRDYKDVEEAKEFANSQAKEFAGDTKFSQYQLEGEKENYKEVLVTLPSRVRFANKWAFYQSKGYNEEQFDALPDETKQDLFIEFRAEDKKQRESSVADFKSTHFDEPNILVHLRMNTRTDANGNKVLFLEEVQSDWGQKGKKEGFGVTENDYEQLAKEAEKVHGKGVLSPRDIKDAIHNVKWNTRNKDADYDFLVKTFGLEKTKEILRNYREGSTFGSVPSAPFVTDTNSWTKLGLKVALREAVKQGADKIAWTTGEQQNDRYDLSKKINSITIDKTGANSYMVMARSVENDNLVIDQSYRKEDLPDLIGKELAADMVAEADENGINGGTVYRQGSNLSVGGKGMKGFYGSPSEGNLGIVGNVAKSLFKQEPGTVEIPQGKGILGKPTVEQLTKAKELAEKANDKEAVDFLQEQIDRVSKGQEESFGLYNSNVSASKFFDQVREPSIYTQASIDITPEMRESVEKGLPLFGTKLSEKQDSVPLLKNAKQLDRVEQYLQGLLDQTKNVTGLNAALYTGAVKAMQAAYRLSKDVAKAIQAGIDYLVSKGLSQEEATAEMEILAAPIRKKAEGETKPEAETETETETETEAETETGKKPLRELPEQEGSKIKAILGRSYQATTSEKVAKAIEKIGLFRIPINIDEALERGKQLVKELGFDGAYEVFQDLSPTIFADGIYLDEATRIGVFGALCEELQAKIDDVNTTPGQVLDYAEKLAEVQSKGGKLVSGGAILMRVWQAVLNRTTVPYQYERRVKEWKALFPNSPITAEMEKRLKDAEAKFIELDKKFKDLLAKQKEYEESQAINDIKEGIEEEKKSKKKVPTSILKQLADRVRKLSTTRPSMFTAATPASLVWDAAVEAVATALEAGASVEMAIRKGVDVIIKSPWYKKLSKADQKKAEGEFVNHYASLSEDELGGVEIVNDSIVVPHKLIRYYVEQGITDIDKIAEDIVETLKEDNPNITVRDVRDAITGYAKKTKRKTRPQIDKEIDMLKREGKLQSELEDIQNGIKKEKNPQARATLSDRAKNLTEEIDKIHQELFGHTKRQLTDEQRLAGYKKRAKKAIAELERRKREGDYSKKERRPPVDFDQEAKDIEFEKYLLQEEWEQMVEDESQRLESLSEKSIKSFLTVWGISRWLTVGFDLGVFGIQASMLMFNNAKTTARALANGVKAFKSMSNYRRLESEMKNNRMYMDAKEAGLKLYSLKDEASLKGDMIALATANTAWDSMGSGIAKLLPKKVSTPFKNYWKSLNPFGALERSQAAFMNTLLMGMYASTANIAALKGITSYKQDPEVFKQAAKVTNTLARRTSLGGLENSKAFMRSMNFLFFSAQNWASLLKLTTPLILHEIGAKRAGARNWKELSPIQRVALTTLGKWLAATVATTILVKLLSGWDENDDLDEEEKKKEGVITVNVNDARRSDFMKIRVGSQTIDPFSGLAQNIILQTRLLAELFGKRGFVSTQTGIEKNLGEDAVPSPLGLFGRQIEGKLQPSTRLLYMSIAKNVEGQPWYIRQNYITGREVDLRQEFKDATTNLTIKSAKESFDEQNTGWAALFSALAVLGYGISRDERLEEMSIKRQAQETLNPERKKMAYERAFRKYAKEGDVVLAKKMFKKIVDKEENKRPVAYDMFNEIKSDNIPGQYFFPSKDIDELFEVLATEKPIDVKSMSESKAARMQKINALTPEMRERIKSDYGVQYKKLMAAAEILNSLAIPSKADPNVKIDWVKKADSVNWVKEYKKSIGKETEPK